MKAGVTGMRASVRNRTRTTSTFELQLRAAANPSRWYPENQLNFKRAWIMAKYFLGWILGVPVIVLVIIYVLFN